VDLCQYPIDRVSPCVKLKSSSTTTDSVPSRKGFWCRRMSPWLQTCFRCWRSLALSRAPWHRACHPTGKGFGVTTCPTASDPLSMQEDSGVTTFGQVRRPTGNGSGVTTCLVALDPPPSAGGLWRHHVWPGRKGMAPVSPRVPRLQTCLPVWEGFGVATCPMALSL
jgi:hypothetical protein